MNNVPEWDSMSAFEIRLFMKEQGWDSKDEITTNGWKNGFGYSIWFERYDWHGRLTLALTGHHVCFHRHTNEFTEVDNVVRLCAKQAFEAYKQYTKSIPYQNANGETAKDLMLNTWDDPRALIKNLGN